VRQIPHHQKNLYARYSARSLMSMVQQTKTKKKTKFKQIEQQRDAAAG
jgi:hypothetical protein